jgi:hypothetical protein
VCSSDLIRPTAAQNRANNGFPTITVWRNNSDSASGHVQVVRPETSGYVYSAADSCVIAQAGASNFNYGNVRAAYSGGIPAASSHTYALKYYTRDNDAVAANADAYNQPENAYGIDPLDAGN